MNSRFIKLDGVCRSFTANGHCDLLLLPISDIKSVKSYHAGDDYESYIETFSGDFWKCSNTVEIIRDKINIGNYE